MKLYAIVTNEARKEEGVGGSEYVNVAFKVGNNNVGEVELYLHDDDVRHGCDENEWLLRFWKHPEQDPLILTQGHTKGKKQNGKCTCVEPAGDINDMVDTLSCPVHNR